MNKVSVGVTSIIGWITGALLAAPAVVNQVVALLENDKAQLAGPEKWMAILGIISIVVTAVGRYLQSIQIAKVAPEPIAPAGPSAAAGEVQRPESALTPDGAQTTDPAAAAAGAGG